jgi:hypothetical protein
VRISLQVSSSLRAKRGNPEHWSGSVLDCFALLAMTMLLTGCGFPDKPKLPNTVIGAILRLGNTDQINSELKAHLGRVGGDADKISSELLASNFEPLKVENGCKSWRFDEPDDPKDRTSISDMYKYTLFVSVELCGKKLEVHSAYRGL